MTDRAALRDILEALSDINREVQALQRQHGGAHAGHGGAHGVGGAGGKGTSSERRGSSTTSKGYDRVEARESEIRSQSYESAYMVDAEGNVVIEKDGEAHEVGFTAKEVKAMKDATLTHNHPNGWSFTETDVRLAVKAKMAEIRAVTADKVFILRRPEGGWPKLPKFESLLSEATGEVMDRLWQKIREKEISADDADREHWTEMWAIMAEKMGAEYVIGKD